MKGKGSGSGWKGESRRHSLARKGVKTARGYQFNESTCRTCGRTGCEGGRSCEMYAEMHNAIDRDDPFATGESLQAFLETPEGELFLERHFESLYDIEYGGWREDIPYWIDNYEDEVTGEHIYKSDFWGEILEHEVGMHDRYKFGENKSFDGKDYYYAGSFSGGSGELELQADNGELVYDSIGYNFFRIWKPFPKTYISLEEDGTYELVHAGKWIERSDDINKLKSFAKQQDFKLEPILWDEYENKFIKE